RTGSPRRAPRSTRRSGTPPPEGSYRRREAGPGGGPPDGGPYHRRVRASNAPSRGAPVPSSLYDIGRRVAERILALLDAELARWRLVDSQLADPLGSLRALIAAGGKRLRPAFCFWAFVGAGGDRDDPGVVDVAASLELLHTFALVHDDIMDGS